jgi:dGTPase
MDYIDLVKAREEKYLSRRAAKSTESLGRKYDLPPDPNRTEFERDTHRVLHSLPFRRLRNKAQVFYAPKNDHLCTRMEHALHVASISSTICKHLRLNVDLAEAIALAHDLGHPPFGHIGEEILRGLHKKNRLPLFKHEAQSLRVIDRFRTRGETLNLTYEVRDGVVCHCGERFVQTLKRNRQKDMTTVQMDAARRQRPATLEACVVRFGDVISYLGRDYEDAVEAKIVDKELPSGMTRVLGKTNSQIIGTITRDVIQNSKRGDTIRLSSEVYSATNALLQFNIDHIYNNKRIRGQYNRIEQMLSDLFYYFLEVTQETERGKRKKKYYRGNPVDIFYEFLEDMQYAPEEPDAQIVSDFIAGMTDTFATRIYQDLFLVSPPA